MKFFVFFVFIFLLLVKGLPASASEKVEQAAPTQQKQAAPQETKKNPQPPVKINNFQPTERIKADTVVAFPADI